MMRLQLARREGHFLIGPHVRITVNKQPAALFYMILDSLTWRCVYACVCFCVRSRHTRAAELVKAVASAEERGSDRQMF